MSIEDIKKVAAAVFAVVLFVTMAVGYCLATPEQLSGECDFSVSALAGR